jgi:hypothetical protein
VLPENGLYDYSPFPQGKGSIYAQVALAARTVELGIADNLAMALVYHTPVCNYCREIRMSFYQEKTGNWQNLVTKTERDESDILGITEMLWQSYINTEKPYQPLNDTNFVRGSFSCRFSADNSAVGFHLNPHRNSHEYSRAFIPDRIEDLKELTRQIKRQSNGKAIEVTTISWISNLPSIREAFPKKFVETGRKAMDTDILRNDSSWGQLMGSDGRAKKEVVESTVRNFRMAKNLEELIESFPMPVLIMRGKMGTFYDHYGV